MIAWVNGEANAQTGRLAAVAMICLLVVLAVARIRGGAQ